MLCQWHFEIKEERSEEDVSGELIKDSEELNTKEVDTANYEFSMDAVSDVLCPTNVSMRRGDVKLGEVTHFTYYSNTTECERGVNILLPADYSKDKEYAVLYFLHGIFGNENSMLEETNNRIKEIVANLKNDGMIDDIIVVFPNMYATGDLNLQPGFSMEQTAPYDNFINDLVNDLIPFIESNYKVKPGKENRGLIGFSMGGRESLFIGTRRPDLFACTGAISPAPGLTPTKDWAMSHDGQLAEEELVYAIEGENPKLLMICCGTKDGVVGTFPKSYHEILEKNAVTHLWYEVPEADHDANAIRSGLFNYLIRWFG